MTQSSDTASHSPHQTPITLAIYRDLRVGVVVTLVMLAAAIVVERLLATRWQSALSEYFYTSAHSIFIAALLGLATLIFVYRGSSDTEDALLTLAGISALVAALVPQERPKLLWGPVDLDLPPQYKVESVVQLNVRVVVVALVLGWLLTLWQHRHNRGQQTRSLGGTLALYFLRLIVLLGLIALFCYRDKFNDYAHGVAGTLMLSALIATVACAAYVVRREEESPHRDHYRRFYRMIAVAMLVTLIAVVTLHIARPHWLGEDRWIIVLESALILEFTAYWVVQTIDLWDTPDRRERLPEATRNRLAEGPKKRGLAGLKSELVEARKEPPGQRLLRLL